jgi:hypothetical protein
MPSGGAKEVALARHTFNVWMAGSVLTDWLPLAVGETLEDRDAERAPPA